MISHSIDVKLFWWAYLFKILNRFAFITDTFRWYDELLFKVITTKFVHSVINEPLYSFAHNYILGVPIKEFVGLRPKMYSLIYDIQGETKEKRTAKGVAKCAIDKQIRHLNYKQCLFDSKTTINDMNLIRSENHILYINNVRKTGLCNFDDKRFWKNSVQSYAYGHYKIPLMQKCCNVFCW